MLRGDGGWKPSGDFTRAGKGEATVEGVFSGQVGDGMAATGAFVWPISDSDSIFLTVIQP